jgi:hypothetical protein
LINIKSFIIIKEKNYVFKCNFNNFRYSSNNDDYFGLQILEKYGKKMFNSYMEMKNTIPTGMFNNNPMEIMKGMPDMNKMMSEFKTLSKIMKTKR